jgi:hypothetical protein
MPRGTFILVDCYMKNILESVGFDPRTSPPHKPLQHFPDHYTAICSLLHKCVLIYLNSHYVMNGGGDRSGLSLDPWSCG